MKPLATRRSRRRFSRGKKEFVWTAILLDGQVQITAASSSSLDVDLVIPEDWHGGQLGRGTSAVLMRIRGWLAFAADPLILPESGRYGVFAAITKTDDEEIFEIGPQIPDFYLDQDILWTGGAQFSSDGVNAYPSTNVVYDVDVKSKRKLSSTEHIKLVVAAGIQGITEGQNFAIVSGVLRALVALP